jgi:hypothetical protein
MHISFKKIIISLFVTLFGLNSYSNELSCNVDIDCYRFDYTSVEKFKESIATYANKWHLNSPRYALYKVSSFAPVKVNSIADGLTLIKENPGLIYSMGKYIESNNKPKEWQYVFEQSFIRGFNNLKR